MKGGNYFSIRRICHTYTLVVKIISLACLHRLFSRSFDFAQLRIFRESSNNSSFLRHSTIVSLQLPMADKHSDESGSSSIAESSESTVEIRIKTLDSQSYQFHVDKNMLVSAFKEKIASDVGLPVGQQRLIFRGKVLKDELRLSEYHVGSGDTLHLVARQPSESQPSSGTTSGATPTHGSNTGQNANAGGPRPRVSHISHSVVLGTFGDRNEDGNPDLSRVIGAVLNSFGIGGQGQASMGGPMPNMQFNIPVQVAQGNEAGANANNQGQQGNPSQPTPQGFAIPLGPGMALPTLVTPIPDSLHTLSEFMNRMERTLSHNGYQQNQASNGAEGSPAVVLPTSARGVPTPAALAVVMRHAQRLLNGPVTDSLSHTARRLEEEESCTDLTVRTQIQSEAMQSGLAMQHLGALLLELGRTMLTLRIGQSPAESSVNAGPAVYVSPSGPNPIMVQPFPLQTNSVFGGHAAPMNSTPFGPIGVPRHINVHIHAGVGPRGTNVESNQGENGNETSNVPAAAAGVNLESRGVDDSTRSETPASEGPGQPDGSVSEPEVRTDTEGAGNTVASSSVNKSANDVEGASSSTPANDNSKNPSTVPLGLGLGGLQPKRRSRQTKPEVTATSSNVPASSPAGGAQIDPAAMNQMLASPAVDGLLSGVSSQTGIGSPDMLRNMLGQLTQNPAMMNTVNQIAQQIDGNQDLSNMFSGGGGGGGGGFDLSGMIQQMMPIVAQAFGGGGSGLNMLQQTPSVDRQLQSTSINDGSSDSQMNLRDLAEKIEHQESPDVVFSSVVEAAARMNNNGDDLSELLIEEGLVDGFMEMLKSDISRLLEEEEGGK
ncbi:hypothetical protein L2E82_40642 [Cichorium intybus]|uniref:Uncharacterized protein n=1 Tax=Cichorium intybus TaxID=13427 RepID=A0ACB9ALY3_CICIN|nr:hypothetical protein L2E82_40642 [Cichorium intybus]